MNISNNGIALIKQFEGCRLTAYKAIPTEKYWTIGYGHYGSDVAEGMVINQEVADNLLRLDLIKFENKVSKYSKYNWSQNEFDALVSFAYNIGSIDQLTANGTRSKEVIAEKMLLYNKAGGKVLNGLVKRRQAEHDMFVGGQSKTTSTTPKKIGQASIDENGNAKGGKAGNQSGKELNIRNYYKSSWHTVLRCKDENKANMMASAMEQAVANKHIGYDQNQRNTLRTQAQLCGYVISRITTDCECDCSSLVTVCAECSGIPFSYTNAPTTSTMKNDFVKTGYFDALTDSKYLTSDTYLKRGDILVKKGHTVMVL